VRAAFDDYTDAWTRAGSTDPLKERYP